MIIWGWGRQTRRTLGVVGISKCSHCGATAEFHLVQRRTWFTLFFIPVIPYSSEHHVLCSSCEWGWTPTEPDLVQLKAGLRGAMAGPSVATAVRELEASAWHPGDLVKPRVGSVLRGDPESTGGTIAQADRASAAVVLAVRGSLIQVRDSAGRIGWLQSGEVD